MRKSGLTGDEAYALSKRRGTTGDLGPLKKELGLLKEDLSNKITKFYASNQGETHITDSDNGKIQDMMLYGKSSQFTTTGKNLANGQNINCFINSAVDTCGISGSDTGMVIDVSKLTNVSISTRSIQDRYRFACANTVPIKGNPITCYNGANKDGIKDSYTMDTTGYNYLFINATKLEDIQVEKGSVSTSYEPYTGGIPSPNPSYPQEIKSVVNPTVKVSNEDGTKSQTVTLPYTLNAIPVSSGGNVTIDRQQYIADYVDVERGKLVRKCKEVVFNGTEKWRSESSYMVAEIPNFSYIGGDNLEYMRWLFCNKYKVATNVDNNDNNIFIRKKGDSVVIKDTLHQSTVDDWKKYLNDNPCIVRCLSAIPEEIDLTTEEITAFKSLATYYPTTNISVNSEQLDGYTVFNYPISLANGWNYVKQQLNDNRDYIYDMDAQSAEAYVNSEYAVALTELEV